MKKLLLFSAIALLLSAAIGCEEKNEKNWKKLPPATQEGKNTIGCLIDGKLWATNYWGLIDIMNSNISADFSIKNMGEGKDVYCNIFAAKKDYTSISILISNSKIEIGKKLKGELVFQSKGLQFFLSKDPYIYLTKLDTLNHVISGRFSGKVINKYTTETLKITDGRFDMKLRIKESIK